jgi:hypothetical protein
VPGRCAPPQSRTSGVLPGSARSRGWLRAGRSESFGLERGHHRRPEPLRRRRGAGDDAPVAPSEASVERPSRHPATMPGGWPMRRRCRLHVRFLHSAHCCQPFPTIRDVKTESSATAGDRRSGARAGKARWDRNDGRT